MPNKKPTLSNRMKGLINTACDDAASADGHRGQGSCVIDIQDAADRAGVSMCALYRAVQSLEQRLLRAKVELGQLRR